MGASRCEKVLHARGNAKRKARTACLHTQHSLPSMHYSMQNNSVPWCDTHTSRLRTSPDLSSDVTKLMASVERQEGRGCVTAGRGAAGEDFNCKAAPHPAD